MVFMTMIIIPSQFSQTVVTAVLIPIAGAQAYSIAKPVSAIMELVYLGLDQNNALVEEVPFEKPPL